MEVSPAFGLLGDESAEDAERAEGADGQLGRDLVAEADETVADVVEELHLETPVQWFV